MNHFEYVKPMTAVNHFEQDSGDIAIESVWVKGLPGDIQSCLLGIGNKMNLSLGEWIDDDRDLQTKISALVTIYLDTTDAQKKATIEKEIKRSIEEA